MTSSMLSLQSPIAQDSSSASMFVHLEAVPTEALGLGDGASPTTPERPTVLPGTMQRLLIARARIHQAARAGQRIRTYEIALDLDMSEFHFARQFRLAFERSPHVYYDEVRADSARAMLSSGLSEGNVARRIGFRRPAELRALLAKRPAGTLPPELAE